MVGAGDDYTGATTDGHVGYEGALGDSGASFYVQGVSAIVSVDGEELSTRVSGKAGVGIPVTDALSAYGEVELITAEDEFLDDLGVGGKARRQVQLLILNQDILTTSLRGGFFMVKFGLTLTIY